jgi:hypothetical protein
MRLLSLVVGVACVAAAPAPPPQVELRLVGDGWRAGEPAEVERRLTPQLARQGFALCKPPCEDPVATLVAELPAPDRLAWRIERSPASPAELAADAQPWAGAAPVEPEAGRRPLAVARRLFGALGVLRSLRPPDDGADDRDPETSALTLEPSRLDIALGAEVRGYTDGLTEIRGGAEIRGWLFPRFGAAVGLNAGQMLTVEDDEVGTVRSFSVGGHAALLAALRPRSRGFDLNARAELGLVDRDFGSDGGLTEELGFGLVLAGGLEAALPLDDRFALLARAQVGAPLVESRAEAEGRVVTGTRGVELSGGLAVVVRVLR